MSDSVNSFQVGSTYSWNGPVCGVCGRGYLGNRGHTCSVEDLQQKIDYLQQVIDRLKDPTPQPTGWGRDTSTCPCNPLNGGSGVCGCTLSGPTITC